MVLEMKIILVTSISDGLGENSKMSKVEHCDEKEEKKERRERGEGSAVE